MIVFLVILSLALLGVIIFFAISSKSSRILKIASLIALGAICLSLVICIIIIVIGPAEDPMAVHVPVFDDTPSQGESGGRASDIIILVIFLLVISLVIAKASRDQKKLVKAKTVIKASPAPVFEESNELDGMEHEELLMPKEAEDIPDDDFDLEM